MVAEDGGPEVGPLDCVDDRSQRVEDPARRDEQRAGEARGLDDLREATTPIQPRKIPAATGTQRGASSQKSLCTIASAAPIQTTAENRELPSAARDRGRPYGVYVPAIRM